MYRIYFEATILFNKISYIFNLSISTIYHYLSSFPFPIYSVFPISKVQSHLLCVYLTTINYKSFTFKNVLYVLNVYFLEILFCQHQITYKLHVDETSTSTYLVILFLRKENKYILLLTCFQSRISIVTLSLWINTSKSL